MKSLSICFFAILFSASMQLTNICLAQTVKTDSTYFLTLKSKMQLNGYSQIRGQFLFDTTKATSFDLRRIRLNLQGNITPKILYRLQLDFAGSPKIVDGYFQYTYKPFLKITVGQYKIPFSLENITSSSLMYSINRSQVVEGLVARGKDPIGNQNGRDIGLQVSGQFLQNKRSVFEYAVELVNGNGINTLDNDRGKDVVGRLIVSPLKNLWFGGSFYKGRIIKDDHLNPERNRAGGELSYTAKFFAFSAEYIAGIDNTTHKEGYYGQLTLFPMKHKYEGLIKYDYYDSNIRTPKTSSLSYIIGFNWLPNSKVKLQLHYDYRVDTDKFDTVNDAIIAMVQISY